jgi:FkbM family methyltransferase
VKTQRFNQHNHDVGLAVQPTRAKIRENVMNNIETIMQQHALSLCENANPFMNGGKFADALLLLNAANQILPNIQNLNYARGYCFFQLRKYVEAKIAFENELQIQPNHKDSLNLLHQVLIELNKTNNLTASETIEFDFIQPASTNSCSTITMLVSVCCQKDINTWKKASVYVLKYIDALNYRLIVPDKEVELFQQITPKEFDVIGESIYLGRKNLNWLRSFFPENNKKRAGWYLQQLIKIAAAASSENDNDIILIWDADTLPLKKLSFISQDNKLVYYTGNEHHVPYFQNIKRLLGLSKIVQFSFIAQCFPVKCSWVKEYISEIERLHNLDWMTAIVNSLDFNEENSGFSEYESIGTFLTHTHQNEIEFCKNSWQRFGSSLIGLNNMSEYNVNYFSRYYDFMSFESWDKEEENLKNVWFDDVDEFYNFYFSSKKNKIIIQVGANDCEMDDPLRKYLCNQNTKSFSAVLIEPLPFYVNKLKKLYERNPSISIIQAACGKFKESKNLFYISPHIADKMNGSGPMNNWAHGQGSFDKDVIIYWINQNSFRGKEYTQNIPLFINSIQSTLVDVIPLSEISLSKNNKNLLVVMDVQGFELDVINGIDWNYPPAFIVVEDDLEKGKDVFSYLTSRHYKLVGGKHDKIYSNITSNIS